MRKECLEKELARRNVPFVAQQPLKLTYKEQELQQTYKPDLICYGKIIVELKAIKVLFPEHQAQIFNYLKVAGLRLGLVVNFGHYPRVQIERVIL